MNEFFYDGSLAGLFQIFDETRGGPLDNTICRLRSAPAAAAQGRERREQPELFGGVEPTEPSLSCAENSCFLPFVDAVPCAPAKTTQTQTCTSLDFFTLPEFSPLVAAQLYAGLERSPSAREFLELSAAAHDIFLLAWLSEFPLERELLSFAAQVLSAGRAAAVRKAGRGAGETPARAAFFPEARAGAEKAALDRGDPATARVLDAAYKVRREACRLTGLLRFSPEREGYAARCGPDHFTLPLLSAHFYERFGPQPWLIIDEKRGFRLVRRAGEEPRLFSGGAPRTDRARANEEGRELWPAETRANAKDGNPCAAREASAAGQETRAAGPWEDLWRGYHRAVNNENRANPRLQCQFMPQRYWKYLPEMREQDTS
jgi:hypothetical protein